MFLTILLCFVRYYGNNIFNVLYKIEIMVTNKVNKVVYLGREREIEKIEKTIVC